MKNISIVIAILLFLSELNAKPTSSINKTINKLGIDTLPVTDSVLVYLSSVNLSNFVNNPINSFLNSISRTYDSMHVASCASTKEGMYNACYLQVEFGRSAIKDFTIKFFVKDFLHMNKYSATRNWNASQMKQEKAYRIEIYYLWDKINSASL